MATVSPNQPIHPILDERISVKVEGQLPDFVKQDHATFVAFLEAYYEYMEQNGKPYEIVGNLRQYANLDATTEDFLNYFKKQFAKDLPEAIFANANKPFVLKHLRDFYRSKGNEKSFRFLFRLLYKEEINFYYPNKDMLRVSDGKYTKNKIVRVVDTTGNDGVFDLLGRKIKGTTSGASALVETILKEHVGAFVVSTIFLSNVNGTFTPYETITDDIKTFVLGGMVTGATITAAGNNYIKDTVIPMAGGGTSAAGAFISIDDLSTGFIKSIIINSGGSGYSVGDKLIVNNVDKMDIDGRTASFIVRTVDGSGGVTAITIESAGRGYTSLPTVSGGSGTGLSVTLNGEGIGGIKTLRVVNNGFGYVSTPILDLSGMGDGTASAVAVVSSYENEHNKQFIGDDGFLSATKYIQDSHYYQLFSYVLTSSRPISEWKDIVKRTAHPAGLALFGNIQFTSNITTPLSITGIPERRHYTIIFHQGTITPPVVADLKVDSCEGERVLVFLPDLDYRSITESELEDPLAPQGHGASEDWGYITAQPTTSDDYGLTIQSSWYVAPTKCQIYEVDLAIQRLMTLGDYEDYLVLHTDVTATENYGLITGGLESTDDFGILTGSTQNTTQLRLGPLKRGIDRNKFKKQGGFSQVIGVGLQSGTGIGCFGHNRIVDMTWFGGLKTRNLNNATITQYLNGNENSALPPPIQ